MALDDFDYYLPEELIAQQPTPDRDGARMLVLRREAATWEDRIFRDLPSYLCSGDCLVLNDSRVFPSRLFGHRPGHIGRIEVFMLHALSTGSRDWLALARPGRKVRVGDVIAFAPNLSAEVMARGEMGERTLRFLGGADIHEALEEIGHVPLPPYIKRPDEASDRTRYQTVFARERGSVAAPTAGLHFTDEMLGQAGASGAAIARVTLHVGLGTFQPVSEETVARGRLHSERYSVDPAAWQTIQSAKRVVAVGTTAVRTIETVAATGRLSGETDIFIQPGFEFQRTGALLTNFHLPRTSLMMLVSALAGRELTLAAYRHAVTSRYRFFSYGDCMLILP